MNGNELLRKLHRLARTRGVEIRIDQRKGKGSHRTRLSRLEEALAALGYTIGIEVREKRIA